MNDEARLIQEQISDLLRRWHRWAALSESVGSGYPSECSSCKQFRASRQYDSENGAIDLDNEARLMVHVDALIEQQIREPMLSALRINARNLSTGVSVWRSPRLPENRDEVAAITMRAREQFASLLDIAGLL